MTRRWKNRVPEALGVSVALGGSVEVIGRSGVGEWQQFLVPLGIGLAVAFSRRAPDIALAIVWGTCVLQIAAGLDVLAIELAIAVVAFGTARWGNTATLWCGAVSIPLGATIAVVFVRFDGPGGLVGLADYQRSLSNGGGPGAWWVTAGLIGVAVVGAPWLAGLAFRFGDRARTSQVSQLVAEEDAARAVHASEQAREIARLRQEQARVALDVHDAVGHSLAVILAQAESGQYLEGTQALKQSMSNIAASARSSLQEVRHVLTATNGQGPTVQPGGLDSLIEGVRASRLDVESSVVGTPRSLPAELDAVAFRVLQEMLTNALKHGRPDSVVAVERHWDEELRIQVRNSAGADSPEGDTVHLTDGIEMGQGIEGMRRRLKSVDGRLGLRRRDDAAGSTFTATAWIPLRTARQ